MKSIQLSLEAWPYRRECRGHDPTKKEESQSGCDLRCWQGLPLHTVK